MLVATTVAVAAAAPGGSPALAAATTTTTSTTVTSTTTTSSATSLSVTAEPSLQPAFDPNVHNYVTRCEPSGTVGLSVTAPASEPVSVDGQPTETGSFVTNVGLATGQRFAFQTGTGAGVQSYNVRCLPQDFPQFTAERLGQPQAAYFLTTPTLSILGPTTPYVALFDDNGVPIWWYRSTDGIPLNAQLLNDGDLSWNVETDGEGPFGENWGDHLEEHSFTGALDGTLRTWFTPTDFHESTQLPNGDFLMTSYVPTPDENLTSIGVPWPTTVMNASFQEITPQGYPVFWWNSQGHMQPAESLDWWDAIFIYPGTGLVWDWDHINSVAADGNDFLVSFRHTDAIYLIRRSDGSVEWKLGGTPTPQSLKIIGDPDAATDFGGQHDARVLPDGTISVHDNGTGRGRPPRVLRFRIDTQARTATLIQELTDPDITSSPCCGSARLLPGGDWVVDWGGTGRVEELTATSQPVYRIDFAAPIFSYRAVPILPGRLNESTLIADMDEMYPRG